MSAPAPASASTSTTVTTACPLDCPDACRLEVVVEDDRIASVDGAKDGAHPLTDGFICAKVRRIAEHVHGGDRLLHPMVRVGAKGEGRFERVSWDEALQRVAESLIETRARHGAPAILPFSYGGSNGLLTQDTADARLFHRLGASLLERTVCAAPSGAAARGLYGRVPGVALEDYVHSRLIVLWGMNPQASGIHLVPVIKAARAAGAKLVVVDPRRTGLAAGADLHVPVRPGGDLPLALSIIHWLFESGRADAAFLAEHATGVEVLRARAALWPIERAAAESGVAAETIERFARLYADAAPAAIRCGWGVERNRNGGSAVAAVLALPAVAGKLGVRGGGFTMSNGGAFGYAPLRAAAAPVPKGVRSVSMNQLGHALTELSSPRIHHLFVYNANPDTTIPDQERIRAGLARDDLFTVVFEQVMTDTALWADVLLPATTFLEHDELARGYGAMVTNRMRPVIPPVGEARTNLAVFDELARRVGVAKDDDVTEPDALIDAIVATGDPDGRLAIELQRDGIARGTPEGAAPPVLFHRGVLPDTPGGKIRLVPEHLDREAPGGLYHYAADPGTPAFPLALISPASERTISSTFGQLIEGQVPIAIHPDDAGARGITTGDVVRVWNELGEVRCHARVDDALRPGVVSLAKGIWARHTLSGTTSTALCPATLTDIGRGACFNDARVQIERGEAGRPGSP